MHCFIEGSTAASEALCVFLRDEDGLKGLREALSAMVAASDECAEIGLFPVEENEDDDPYTQYIKTRKIVHEVNKAVEYSVHCYADPVTAQSPWCRFWLRDSDSGQDGLNFVLSMIAHPDHCPLCAGQGIVPLSDAELLGLLEMYPNVEA